MILYQIKYPGGTPEPVVLDREDGPVPSVNLGEQGRGRVRQIIPILGSGPEVRAKRTDEGVVLVRGEWGNDDDRCLVVVKTVGAYDRCRSYGLFEDSGVEVIATGIFAFGAAGRVNGGEEVLLIASRGAEFRLNSKYSSTWYTWTSGGWVVETVEKRQARLALAAVENGEGEWI